MRTIDLSPLYSSAIGVDRLAAMMDAAIRKNTGASYPPYNIERLAEQCYRITMAVAGFSQDDIDILLEGNTLSVRGRPTRSDQPREYLHQGIAERNFERHFQLADGVRVERASMEHGLLRIDLATITVEPPAPQRIPIASS
ncbi:Hsp20 family protein [Gammaproteobacteria bacterium]|nr:Hsp20 family protein [Gammaproteobacteria bacterium]